MKNFFKKLTLQVEANRLSHAYIVFGQLDEKSLAKILLVNPPDLFVLSENPIKISHIRELNRFIQLRPHSSLRKLAILYGIESMTTESGNALLKLLEEPPSSSILVLQAKKNERILPTILSRCQTYKAEAFEAENNIDNYFAPDKIGDLSIKERFDYAAVISQSEDLDQILNSWESYYRSQMLEGLERLKILKQISATKDLLLTNSSVKLLLENLLLDF
jgi:DNA polymerase III subunit delta'